MFYIVDGQWNWEADVCPFIFYLWYRNSFYYYPRVQWHDGLNDRLNISLYVAIDDHFKYQDELKIHKTLKKIGNFRAIMCIS